MTSELEPSPVGQQLAEAIINDDELQAQVLAETINSGNAQRLEAGRTMCGVDGDPRPARDRAASSIQLEPCARGDPTGIIHTHPTPRGLRSPTHSLPDLANVAFEDVDASVVAGAETSSVVVAATDRDRQADAFRNALGLNTDSTRGVVAALRDGRISDPAAARRRVIEAFGPLVSEKRTPHPEIVANADTEAFAAASPHGQPPIECCLVSDETAAAESGTDGETADAQGMRSVRQLRYQSRVAADVGGDVARWIAPPDEIRSNAVGTVVGFLTARAIERALFGD